jgi:hypothetical protein
MKKIVSVANQLINVILGEDTPPAADFVRVVRKTPFATR